MKVQNMRILAASVLTFAFTFAITAGVYASPVEKTPVVMQDSAKIKKAEKKKMKMDKKKMKKDSAMKDTTKM